MPDYPHHETLRLVNFTTFADASFVFSPTLNALVGENGTGKTHLMKVMYAYQLSRFRAGFLGVYLSGVFQTGNLPDLLRYRTGNDIARARGVWGNTGWMLGIHEDNSTSGKDSRMVSTNKEPETMSRPVFIPAVDMMGHTRRFVSTFDEYNIDFDQTHRDVVALLLSPERRQNDLAPELLAPLEALLGGTLTEEGERFYLETPQGRQPMPLVAEGLRKVATLYQLLRNGFLQPGSTLFWDEPEVNINPKLMDEIVDILLRLARTGVQIFLATHSYVILKELDLQATPGDAVRYFALEPTPNGTVVHATDNYTALDPNPIAAQFDSLYDRQLTKSVGKRRHK